MSGAQNKYAIDVTNRFTLDDGDIDPDEGEAENFDPFEELKILNQKAIEAKNVPKPKVTKTKVLVQTATKVEIEREADKKPDNNRRQKNRPNDKRERRPKPIRTNDEKNDVNERPKREYKPRGEGDSRRAFKKDGEKRFDRKSRDPKSSHKAFEKKVGAGSGNWGTAEDELAGQTEKIELGSGDKTEDPEEEKLIQFEQEPATMTLEEYRNQSRSVNRNPNAKVQEQQTEEVVRPQASDVRRKGRIGRLAPVDFRPAPLVQRSGDKKRRDGLKNDIKEKTSDVATYNLANDFPSL